MGKSHRLISAEVMDSQAQRHDPVYLEVLETLTRAWSEQRKVRVWHQHGSTGKVHTYVLYEIPEDFDPREQLRDAWGIWYTDEEPVEVALKFHPRVAGRVQETQWHGSQELEPQPDGGLIWRAKIAEPQEMLPWIRGWGADVEVVEPESLRNELAAEARRLARQYGWEVHRIPSGESREIEDEHRFFDDFFA